MAEIPVTEIFYTPDRSKWRSWLSENFETAKDIWFVFPTKGSGEPALSYNGAVEEALCFGWIDSTAKRLDDTHQIRRFTPRRKGSSYSRANIERLIWLDSQGLIHPKVRPSVAEPIEEEFVFPEDILDSIRGNADAWKYYRGLSLPYRGIRIAYIDAARDRPEEFRKRLDNFISVTARGRIIGGYGGIDKYYH